MKPRVLARTIKRAIATFPAVVVTGPRQSGKTTLLRSQFGKTHNFVSLENPDQRMRAKEDPQGFLAAYPPPVILDEIQYVPELLPYIKSRIDEDRRAGQWLITGSQHFPLMEGASQSLAGRAAILTLLPFSFSERIGRGEETREMRAWLRGFEIKGAPRAAATLASVILRGSYPEPASNPRVDRQIWCASYIATYLERDVRNLAQIGDLGSFERFLKLCAVRTGQILNLSDMARDIGVSVPTAKRWLSLLETGGQIFLLPPYYRNLGKRLIKHPKLYFNDTALATYLLGIHDKETLRGSPQFGALFETMVVMDVLKRFVHFGALPSLYYLRTRDGLEVDLVIEVDQKLNLFEIKSLETITPTHATSLLRLRRGLSNNLGMVAVISAASENVPVAPGVIGLGWQQAMFL